MNQLFLWNSPATIIAFRRPLVISKKILARFNRTHAPSSVTQLRYEHLFTNNMIIHTSVTESTASEKLLYPDYDVHSLERKNKKNLHFGDRS